ncbi:MAG: hypothetical protein JRI34_01670 [Deltaproteobacteria bacterium]|nr:hypothetical protein [Deltaproteobacteria bacterium]
MQNIEKVAFLTRCTENIWECTRSCVGLGIENLNVALFIIDAAIEIGDRMEAYLDYLEMINDLEGEIFTNVRDNADRFSLIRFMPLEDMAVEIRKYDLLSVF